MLQVLPEAQKVHSPVEEFEVRGSLTMISIEKSPNQPLLKHPLTYAVSKEVHQLSIYKYFIQSSLFFIFSA